MVRRTRVAGFLIVLGCALGVVTAGEERPTIAAKTKGMERRDGLLPVWVDRAAGGVWLELPAAGPRGGIAELLYVEGLGQGVGSNPIGLDRGQLGDAVLLRLRRVGERVLFEQPNLGFRAVRSGRAEREAVRESFATSVLWAAPVAAEDAAGRTLIDLRGFLVRDAHDVSGALARAGEGDFKLDAERSAVDLDALLAFPRNLEFEAVLTFAGAKPGRGLREVVPTPDAVTVVQHHSLLALPDGGYRPRRHDPRAGSFAIRFQDYAVPLQADIETRWIVRHRLEKTDPSRARSPVREPIVYYVDPGTPEPVRAALIEGASWWADAFDAAGFVDAFRVELLPEGAHPLDARYNVIQWVHRSTRGWSYGGGVVDPRTGEMIKGHVSLGSLRVRQDRLLFEGLLGAEKTGSGAADDPVELALARIRQLAAHEVGHTLGLNHNFAASTYGRASVMDYPAPWIRLRDGRLDASQAYGVGVGAWDRHAIRYAYAEFAPGADEEAELETVVREGLDAGLVFLTDRDARPAGAALAAASLWDNGADAVAELRERLAVRRFALDRFGARNLAPGRPLALLEEVLATVYLHHRFQLDAAVKLIGGVDYRYAFPADGQPPMRAVDAVKQREALAAALSILDPSELDLDDEVLALVLPRPAGYGDNRELFRGSTDPLFDPLAAAATAADQVVRGLLQPQRAARVVEQRRRDGGQLSLEELLDALVDRAFGGAAGEDRAAEIRGVVRHVVVDGLARLLASADASPAVRARAHESCTRLLSRLDGDASGESAYLAARLRAALERPLPAREADPSAADAPPGSPIGCSMEPGPRAR